MCHAPLCSGQNCRTGRCQERNIPLVLRLGLRALHSFHCAMAEGSLQIDTGRTWEILSFYCILKQKVTSRGKEHTLTFLSFIFNNYEMKIPGKFSLIWFIFLIKISNMLHAFCLCCSRLVLILPDSELSMLLTTPSKNSKIIKQSVSSSLGLLNSLNSK